MIRRREQVVFQQFKVASQRMLAFVKEQHGDKDPRVMTLRSIISTCEIAEAVMGLVVGAVASALDDSQSLLHKAVSAALKVGVVMPSRVLLGRNGLNQLVSNALQEAEQAKHADAGARPKIVVAKGSGQKRAAGRKRTKEARRA
ncbi:MAG: hypothetical protein ACKO4Q_04135 [Planctomycetota bacterium]